MKTHDSRLSLLSHPTLGVSSENLKAPISLHEAGWYFQVTLGSLYPDACAKGHAPQDLTAEPPTLPVPKGHPCHPGPRVQGSWTFLHAMQASGAEGPFSPHPKPGRPAAAFSKLCILTSMHHKISRY